MRWVVVVLAGCAVPYRTHALPATSAQLACLDVWLETATRSEAEGPVVVIHLGNRCDHSTRVDLGAIKVVGLDENGATWPLTAYDPRHEIEPRRIDALAWGDEWIEFHGGQGLVSLDVDVGSIEAPGPPRWIRLAVPR